jgi:hypothetical protein
MAMDYDTVARTLAAFGEPPDQEPAAWPRYVQATGVGAADVPVLLELMAAWADPDHFEGRDRDDVGVFAPVHAWRTLAQLGAQELIPAALDLLEPLLDLEDDWLAEDLPDLVLVLGADAIAPLLDYVDDTAREDQIRGIACAALVEITRAHDELRARVLPRLLARLEQADRSAPVTNAAIIEVLVELGAREHVDVIARAYAANVVETEVIGTYNDVLVELGLRTRHATKAHGGAKADKRAKQRQKAARKANRRR